MAAHITLQELTTQTAASATQPIQDAVDVGSYGLLMVQLRLPKTASAGTLKLQHAAILEESAFTDITSPTFDLTGAANQVNKFAEVLRFVRWTCSGLTGGPASFAIHIIARES